MKKCIFKNCAIYSSDPVCSNCFFFQEEKPYFKNEKWLCSHNPTSLFRYKSSGENNLVSICEIYKFIDNKQTKSFELEISDYGIINSIHVNKPTHEQIKHILSKVAEQKGFKKGVTINQRSISLNYCDNKTIESDVFSYDYVTDSLLINGILIYSDGKWADIVTDPYIFTQKQNDVEKLSDALLCRDNLIQELTELLAEKQKEIDKLNAIFEMVGFVYNKDYHPKIITFS